MINFNEIDLNENKYFIGIMMILVNIGSRFIISELNDKHKEFINNKNLRRLFIFGVFFIATRDISVSLLLTLMFVLFVTELFNENSDFSLIEKNLNNNLEKKDSKVINEKKLQDTIDTLYDIKNNL